MFDVNSQKVEISIVSQWGNPEKKIRYGPDVIIHHLGIVCILFNSKLNERRREKKTRFVFFNKCNGKTAATAAAAIAA